MTITTTDVLSRSVYGLRPGAGRECGGRQPFPPNNSPVRALLMMLIILMVILIMHDILTQMTVFYLMMPVLILTLWQKLIGLPLLAADFWLMSARVLILGQLPRLSLLGCDLFNPKTSSGLSLSHTCPHRS